MITSEPFPKRYIARAVSIHDCESPENIDCQHGCQNAIQFCRSDGLVLYELCEIDAECLAGLIVDAIDEGSRE